MSAQRSYEPPFLTEGELSNGRASNPPPGAAAFFVVGSVSAALAGTIYGAHCLRDCAALPLEAARESDMRCFFLKKGHIVEVELLTDFTDQAAIERAHKLYSEARIGQYDGFEIMDQGRVVFRYEGQPPPRTSC